MIKDIVTPYFINKAVLAYNLQFNTNFDTTNANKIFTLVKIDTEVNTDYQLAYEVVMNDPNLSPPSGLRLRNYLATNGGDTLGYYQQQLDDSVKVGTLGDEVMVAYGGISNSTITALGLNVMAWMRGGSETIATPTLVNNAVTPITGGFSLQGTPFRSTRSGSSLGAMMVTYTLPGNITVSRSSGTINFSIANLSSGVSGTVSIYYTSNFGVNSDPSDLFTFTVP